MTNYTWSFDLKVSQEPYDDTVTEVHWRLSGERNGDVSSVYGSVSLAKPGDDFIAFDNLTEDTVKAWCLADMQQSEADLKASVDRQIDDVIEPQAAFKSAPWLAA